MTDHKAEAIKVYAFCNSGSGTDMQTWMAMAETGECITSHLSSSRAWGIHDVGPEWKRDHYVKALGEEFDVEYIVVEDRQPPPAHVVEANRKLGEAAKAADSAVTP